MAGAGESLEQVGCSAPRKQRDEYIGEAGEHGDDSCYDGGPHSITAACLFVGPARNEVQKGHEVFRIERGFSAFILRIALHPLPRVPQLKSIQGALGFFRHTGGLPEKTLVSLKDPSDVSFRNGE